MLALIRDGNKSGGSLGSAALMSSLDLPQVPALRSTMLPDLHAAGVSTLPNLPDVDDLIEERLTQCRRRFYNQPPVRDLRLRTCSDLAAKRKAERRALATQSLGDLPSLHCNVPGSLRASLKQPVHVKSVCTEVKSLRGPLAQLSPARHEDKDWLDELVAGRGGVLNDGSGDSARQPVLELDLSLDRQRQCCMWSDERPVVLKIIEELTKEELPELLEGSDEGSDFFFADDGLEEESDQDD